MKKCNSPVPWNFKDFHILFTSTYLCVCVYIYIYVMINQKQLENVEYFNYLVSFIINDARHKREIKSRIAMAESAFNRKKTIFTSKLDLNLGRK